MGVIKVINLDYLYYPYKKDLSDIYEKYFYDDGICRMNFKNTPIAIFACDYVKYGKDILSSLDSHVFIKYEYDRYSESVSVVNDTHKYNAAKRVIDIVDSIREFGYCCGKYDKSKYMVRVVSGFSSPYGNNPVGYTLHTRKHRAAACIALGIKEIRVQVV